jgi:hypothetical protein
MMKYSTHFARLISLDRRYIENGSTRVVGFVSWRDNKRQRILFSEKRWPLGHLRYFLQRDLVVIVDQAGQRVMPVPLSVQPENIRAAAGLQLPPDKEWLNSLPTITDQVAERSTAPPKRRRFISAKFNEAIKRQQLLAEAQQRLAALDRELQHLEQVKAEAKRRAAQLKRLQQLNEEEIDSDEQDGDVEGDGEPDEPLWA